ncbi:MAG: hypothetical protein JXA99_02000 [Candidatus Lokiarchaeota archaeon]|nr:hypothetical protein [Candidatus Lokiarchaeota archaeon]
MPTIKKINDNILGEFKVNFSVVNNLFYLDGVDFPKGFKCDIIMDNWSNVEKYISELKDATMYNSKYIKKHIYLEFKTSESLQNINNEKYLMENNFYMDDEVGFKLNWYVLDEFSSNSGRFHKVYPLFKVIESHSGKIHSKTGQMNILGQLMRDGILLDYSDELYYFLINTSEKLKEIISQLAKFINPDPKILMENILNHQLKIE